MMGKGEERGVQAAKRHLVKWQYMKNRSMMICRKLERKRKKRVEEIQPATVMHGGP